MVNRKAGAEQANQRATEGGLNHQNPEARVRRGRPKGSTNKPKSLLPADVAKSLLLQMKDSLPPEQYAYMHAVIVKGETISTKKEVDMLITLMRGALMPYLIREAIPTPVLDDDGDPVLDDDGNPMVRYAGIDKDVSDRLAKLTSLIQLRHNIDRQSDDGKPDGEQPIIQVFAKRGIDPTRLRLLVGLDGAQPTEPKVVSEPLPALPAPAEED